MPPIPLACRSAVGVPQGLIVGKTRFKDLITITFFEDEPEPVGLPMS